MFAVIVAEIAVAYPEMGIAAAVAAADKIKILVVVAHVGSARRMKQAIGGGDGIGLPVVASSHATRPIDRISAPASISRLSAAACAGIIKTVVLPSFCCSIAFLTKAVGP